MQVDWPPFDIPPSNPITGGNLPLKELGIQNEEEEEVLDITRLSFYQI